MDVALPRAPLSLRPSLVVARFTMLSVLRRRWSVAAGGIGLILLVIDGVYSKASDVVPGNVFEALRPHRLAYQVFASSAPLTAVVIGGLTMVVAMSIIRDDLGGGAAELLFTKPLPRPSYALGKVVTLALTVAVAAVVIAPLRIGVLLAVLHDSAYLTDSVLDTLAIAADAFVIGLIVLAVSSWGSSLAAGLVAVILFLMATVSAPLMGGDPGHHVVDSQALLVSVAYDVSPRMLSGPRNYYSVVEAPTCPAEPGRSACIIDGAADVTVTAGSSAVDVIAWAGYCAGAIVILLLGIRRFSGRLTE